MQDGAGTKSYKVVFGVGFPLHDAIHTAYEGEYRHFWYLICLVSILAACDTNWLSKESKISRWLVHGKCPQKTCLKQKTFPPNKNQHTSWKSKPLSLDSMCWNLGILLMEEISNNHLGCSKPCKYSDVIYLYQVVQDFFHQQYLIKCRVLMAILQVSNLLPPLWWLF